MLQLYSMSMHTGIWQQFMEIPMLVLCSCFGVLDKIKLVNSSKLTDATEGSQLQKQGVLLYDREKCNSAIYIILFTKQH